MRTRSTDKHQQGNSWNTPGNREQALMCEHPYLLPRKPFFGYIRWLLVTGDDDDGGAMTTCNLADCSA